MCLFYDLLIITYYIKFYLTFGIAYCQAANPGTENFDFFLSFNRKEIEKAEFFVKKD